MAKRKTSKEYGILIHRVRKINPEAANWLRDVAPTMGDSFDPCGDLSDCFWWCMTPQGHMYWKEIDNKLKGRK